MDEERTKSDICSAFTRCVCSAQAGDVTDKDQIKQEGPLFNSSLSSSGASGGDAAAVARLPQLPLVSASLKF